MSEQQLGALALRGPTSEIQFRLARSLKTAEVGEVMALDARGDVLEPRRGQLSSARLWLTGGALGGIGWASMAALGGAGLLGPVFFGACLGLMAWEQRKLAALKQAIALASAGKRDEATAAFAELAGRGPLALRATVDYWQATLSWQRGDFDRASTTFDSALARCRRAKGTGVLRWIIQYNRVQLLAVRGDVRGAYRLQRTLEDAPKGEYFRLAHMLTELSLAFHSGDDRRLPEDLYDWAREALEMTRFGHGLVLLGWAFAQRGDADMAAHLLREAPDRLESSYFAEMDPRLSEWFERTFVEWRLDQEPAEPCPYAALEDRE